MATANTRDTTLGIAIETAGEDNIRRLAAEVRGLAKEGGDAAPEYARLAAELDKLAAEASDLEAFRRLAADLGALNTAQQQAVQSAERLRAEYQEAVAAAEPLRAKQEQLQTALNETKDAMGANKRALDLLRQGFLDDGETKDMAIDRERRLRLAIADQKDAIAAYAIDLRNLKPQVREAADEEQRLEKALNRAGDAALAQQQAFQQQAKAVDEMRAAAARAGQDLTNLDAAEERFTGALRNTVVALEQRATITRDQADLDRQAAAAAATLADRVAAAAAAYERDQVAAHEAAAAAAREETAALKQLDDANEQVTAALRDRLAASAASFERDQAAAHELAAAAAREEAAALKLLDEANEQVTASLRDRLAATAAAFERDQAAAHELAAAAAREEAAALKQLDEANDQVAASLRERLTASAAAYERDLAALRAQQIAQEVSTVGVVEYVKALEREEAQLKAVAAAQDKIAGLIGVERNAAVVRDLAVALNAVDVQAEQAAVASKHLADATQQAGKELKDAFGQTGVRSMQAIVAEMNTVQSSVARLRAEYVAGTISTADLDRATSSAAVKVARLRTELQSIPALPNIFEKINSSIQDAVTRFGALSAALATVGFAVKPVLDAATQFENLRRTLTFVTGSATTAGEQIAFLREQSLKAGLSAGALSEQFGLFEASMLKSGQSLQTTQALFGGVANAAGQLGISTDRTGNILLALGQIANKGKLSLEELQGQIGESLPGALKIAADSLGITTGQMGKLLADGKILADDFLPAFAAQLTKTFSGAEKPVDGLVQAFNRLKTAASTTASQLVDTAGYKSLTGLLDGLARNFDTVVTSVTSAGKAFLAFKAIDIAREFFGIKAAAELAAAAKVKDAEAAGAQTAAVKGAASASRDAAVATTIETDAVNLNTAAKVRNAEASVAAAAASRGFAGGALAAIETGFSKTATAVGNAASKVGGFVSALGGPYGVALGVAVAFSDQLGNGIAKLAAKFTGLTGEIAKNEAALNALNEADKKRVAAVQAANDAITASFVKVQVTYDQEIEAADKRLKVTDKLLKAKKDEGEAAVTLAGLTGEEVNKLDAAAKATGELTIAIAAKLSAQQAEVDLLTREREELAKAAGAQSKWTEDRKKFFADFDQNLEKKKADIEVTKQQAAAEGAAADAAFLAAKNYRDNSKSLDTLKQAVTDAKQSYALLVQAYKDGFATETTVRNSARDLAVLEGRLKDAYDDATKALQRRQAAAKEQAGLTQQEITLKRTQISTDLQIADITGQYINKLQAQIKLKQLDVDESRQKVTVATQEAKLLREEATLLQERLRIGDPLYEQKKREIDSILNAAKAKMNEGMIEQENIRKLNLELGILDGTLFQSAKAFTAMGEEAAEAARKLDVFSEAGRKARNAALKSILPDDPRSPAGQGTGSSKLAPTGSTGLNADGSVAGGFLPYTTGPNGERIPLNPADRTAKPNTGAGAFGGVGGTTGVSDAQAIQTAFLAAMREYGASALSNVTQTGTVARGTPDSEKLTVDGKYEIKFTLGTKQYTTYSYDRSTAEDLVHALEEAFRLAGGG